MSETIEVDGETIETLRDENARLHEEVGGLHKRIAQVEQALKNEMRIRGDLVKHEEEQVREMSRLHIALESAKAQMVEQYDPDRVLVSRGFLAENAESLNRLMNTIAHQKMKIEKLLRLDRTEAQPTA